MPRVTVVNDNPEFLELVGDILEGDRYETTLIEGDATNDALDRIRTSQPDVLMIELRLGRDGIHGWAIAQEVRNDPEMRGTPILLCSADLVALRRIEDDLDDTYSVVTLTKPFSIDDLTDRVDQLVAGAQPG
ncbi:MAG: response regulator [Candidatus Limnocylindria bacterium]